MNLHPLNAFDKEVGRLNRQIILMGSFCELQLKNARNAFKWWDNDLAAETIATDQERNRFKRKIQADILSFMAGRQPGDSDLRMLVSLLKIACELERICDYASKGRTLLSGQA